MNVTDVLKLEGDCVLSSVQTHHSALMACFEKQGPLRIDLSNVAHVDLSFVQLIVSAARTAAEAKRPFGLSGLTDDIKAVFSRAGLDVTAAGTFGTQLRGL